MTVPAAMSDTVKSFDTADPNAVVDKIDEMLHTINVVLSDIEKKVIAQEIEKDSVKIRGIFERMLRDLKTPPR